MEGRQYYPPRETVDGNRTTVGGPHSPWHSPVPYLFGGLAAMLGLIAFALLILGCSYWRLSGYFDGEENQSRDSDLEAGDMKPDKAVKAVALPEKFLVIMAGDVNPTYLATPVEKSCTCDDDEDEEGGDDVKGNDQVVRRSTESNGATH
ncbi:PREDICTED: protein GLUTAMINE DUMPER 3-like [Brassica oleracea var. oleracea]|uniref:Protein GLUTAMINE DUMPER 3 n=2 Tax=Brassica TaxID=3705 RepID=A0A0D3ALE4_BRAOL|nr:PREDICTED: protein GLUTAMINE DUMPER 3-like [Brassica oleracea var. oleracea]